MDVIQIYTMSCLFDLVKGVERCTDPTQSTSLSFDILIQPLAVARRATAQWETLKRLDGCIMLYHALRTCHAMRSICSNQQGMGTRRMDTGSVWCQHNTHSTHSTHSTMTDDHRWSLHYLYYTCTILHCRCQIPGARDCCPQPHLGRDGFYAGTSTASLQASKATKYDGTVCSYHCKHF